MNIFDKTDYREILRLGLEERRRIDKSVTFQGMAIHARVPKSYISRVIHDKADFNADQLHLACTYLEMSDNEVDYMQLLLEYRRTSLKERRARLKKSILTYQDQHLDSTKYLNAAKAALPSIDLSTYFLDPLAQLTHACLGIRKYQRDPLQLTKDLRLSPARLNSILSTLEKMQLIRRGKDDAKVLVENIHLPKTDPLYIPWRNQIKLLTAGRLNQLDDDQAYSFTVLFSGDESARRQIQARFMDFLRETENVVGKAAQEGVYQMSFDLFPWLDSKY